MPASAAAAPPTTTTRAGDRVRRGWRAVRRRLRAALLNLAGLFGFGLTVSALAAVPVLNVAALGLMLSAEGRVGRGGWRALVPLLAACRQVAVAAVAVWAFLLPVRFTADLAADAAVIGGSAAGGWRVGVRVLAVAVAAHLTLWLIVGGRTGWFRPLRNVRRAWRSPGAVIDRFGGRVAGLWAELRPGRSVWLGVCGLLVGAAWLFLPSGLLAARGDGGGAYAARVFGGVLLAAVLPLAVAAQAELAATGRLRDGLNPRRAAGRWRRTPGRWWAVTFVVLATALPLYLFKVVAPPRDAVWLLTPAYVAVLLPGRLLAGRVRWSAATPDRRPAGRWWAGLCLVAAWALAAVYVFLLFFTQYIGEHGPRVLLEHPAFLIPAPF